MSKLRGGLGRGLEALIPVVRQPESGEIATIDVTSVEPNPYQPRREWNEDELSELSASIREHGVLQPIVVCQSGTGSVSAYTIVAGERRWRAARLAGLTHVPALIKDVSPQQMLALALVENLQRSDLNALEEAHAYRQLMQQFELTQEQVAGIVGRSRAAVANVLRLLALPEEVQVSLSRGEISEGHARAILSLKDGAQRLTLWRAIVERGLSVREAEAAARSAAEPPAEKTSQQAVVEEPLTPFDRALENDFRSALGTKVKLVRQGGRGHLVVHFYSDEQLHDIYEKLTRE